MNRSSSEGSNRKPGRPRKPAREQVRTHNLALSPAVSEWLESHVEGKRSWAVNAALTPIAQTWRANRPEALALVERAISDISRSQGATLEIVREAVVDARGERWFPIYWRPQKGRGGLIARAWNAPDGICCALVPEEEGGIIALPPSYQSGDPWMDLCEIVEMLVEGELFKQFEQIEERS